jgi:hypothetical protein
MDLFSIFLILCLGTLLRLTYSDLVERKTDERMNFYMMGVTSVLMLLNNLFFVWLVYFVIILLVLGWLKDALKSRIGAGDISTLAWLLPSIAIFDLNLLPILLICIGLSLGIGKVLKVNRFPGLIAFSSATIVVFLIHFWFLA